jgi:low temperature requirement protein LtrA
VGPIARATWLELFFDLIVVVALRAAGEILSETHDGHIAPQHARTWSSGSAC